MWRRFRRFALVVSILVLGLAGPADLFGQSSSRKPPPRQATNPPRSGGQAQSGRQVQPGGQAPRQQAQGQDPGRRAAPKKPAAPFVLGRDQLAELDRVLESWQKRSESIKTFSCEFTLLDYDPAFGKVDREGNIIPTQRLGELKYATPDKGMYKLTHVWNDAQKKMIEQTSEHWICDGKSIFEFNLQKKQLIEHVLPKELQGQAIQNSPLPFVFGSDPGRLKQRYFLRTVTPPDVKDAIWLEAHPRFRADAANFILATLILDANTLLPTALELVSPNRSRKVHRFENSVVNDPWRFIKPNFAKPSLPSGWTKVIDAPPEAPPADAQRAGPPPTDAARRGPPPNAQRAEGDQRQATRPTRQPRK